MAAFVGAAAAAITEATETAASERLDQIPGVEGWLEMRTNNEPSHTAPAARCSGTLGEKVTVASDVADSSDVRIGVIR